MGCRNDQEHGGVDLVDLEVYVKDYLDKFSHTPHALCPDPSVIGPHSVSVRRLTGVDRDEQFYSNFEATVNALWDKQFKASMNTANTLAAQLDMCQGVCKCCVCCQADEDLAELFCSEVAAEAYKSTGLHSLHTYRARLMCAVHIQ